MIHPMDHPMDHPMIRLMDHLMDRLMIHPMASLYNYSSYPPPLQTRASY
jgi:hypothetical protein